MLGAGKQDGVETCRKCIVSSRIWSQNSQPALLTHPLRLMIR